MRQFLFFFCLTFIACKSKGDDYLYGEWYLSDYYYKENCLSCNNRLHKVYFDKTSGWFDMQNLLVADSALARFEFIKKGKEIKLRIYDSNKQFLNGDYLVKIDTLYSSPQRDEIAVSFKSETVFMKGYKNIVKKIGN